MVNQVEGGDDDKAFQDAKDNAAFLAAQRAGQQQSAAPPIASPAAASLISQHRGVGPTNSVVTPAALRGFNFAKDNATRDFEGDKITSVGPLGAALQGATFNTSPKIIAGLKSLFSPASAGAPFDETYPKNLAAQRNANADYATTHPVGSTVAGVAGGAVPMLATAGLGPVAALASKGVPGAMGLGAAYGGAYGLGGSDEGNRLSSMGKGAALGAAGGVLGGVAGRNALIGGPLLGGAIGAAADDENRLRGAGVGAGLGFLGGAGWRAGGSKGLSDLALRGGNALADRAASTEVPVLGRGADALRQLAYSVGPRGKAVSTAAGEFSDPQSAIAKLQASAGKPLTAADVDEGAFGIAKSIRQGGGKTAQTAADFFKGRAEGARGRIIGDLESAGASDAPVVDAIIADRGKVLGDAGIPRDATRGVAADLEGLKAARTASGNALFPEAYKDQLPDEVALKFADVAKLPGFDKAAAMARDLAEVDGVKLPVIGAQPPINNTPQSILSSLPQGERSAAAAHLTNLSKTAPDQIPAYLQSLAPLGAEGSGGTEVPSIPMVHYMMKAVRRAVNSGFDSPDPSQRAQAAVLSKKLGEFTSDARAASKPFDTALTDWADRSGEIDALRKGLAGVDTRMDAPALAREAGKTSGSVVRQLTKHIDTFEQEVGAMPQNEQVLARHGLRQALIDEANNVNAGRGGNTFPVLKQVFGDAPMRKRLIDMAFPNPDEAAAFQANLGGERTMGETTARLGGSDTHQNRATAARLANASGNVAPAVRALVSPRHAVRRFLGGAADAADAGVKQDVAQELLPLTTSTGDDAIKLLQMVAARGKRSANPFAVLPSTQIGRSP